MLKKQNPVAGQGHGAGKIVALGGCFDTGPNTMFNSEALAVARLVRRFGLAIPTARSVAELAMIGGFR